MSEDKNQQPPEPPSPNKGPAKKPQQKQQRITLEIPKDLEAVYANAALIANTPAELVIDFVQVLPRTNKGKMMSRVIMSPMHAKMLQRALTQNIANYERQFGEIRLPQNLADQFFRLPKKGNDEKDDK